MTLPSRETGQFLYRYLSCVPITCSCVHVSYTCTHTKFSLYCTSCTISFCVNGLLGAKGYNGSMGGFMYWDALQLLYAHLHWWVIMNFLIFALLDFYSIWITFFYTKFTPFELSFRCTTRSVGSPGIWEAPGCYWWKGWFSTQHTDRALEYRH